MKKLNLQLMYDKMFRKTIFLRPLPDRSFEAIDITGHTDGYFKDETGATGIDPACIVNVRGLKRVDKIVTKFNGSTITANMFNGRNLSVKPPECKVNCPDCNKEILVQPPDAEVVIQESQQISEKTLGDMLSCAEIAGRIGAEKNPEAEKKQNLMLLLMAASVLIGVVLFFKTKGG